MAAQSRWVWASAPSRLDVRPWGQQHLFKPLVVALAVAHWLEANPEAGQLTLVGCPAEVKNYLREFKQSIEIEGQTRSSITPGFFAAALAATEPKAKRVMVQAFGRF